MVAGDEIVASTFNTLTTSVSSNSNNDHLCLFNSSCFDMNRFLLNLTSILDPAKAPSVLDTWFSTHIGL